jgi:hypothetical protein
VERRPIGLAFVPFGVGQFNNGDNAKGVAFLGSQAALGLTSLVLYVINRDDGLTTGKKSTALEAVQIGTGAAFWGSVLWGILDASLRWRPERVLSERVDEPPSTTPGTPPPAVPPPAAPRPPGPSVPRVGIGPAGLSFEVSF